MPPKPRQVKIESKSALAAMQNLESRSDEELEAETRFKAAAQAILGARAAERMDAKKSREHFRAAIAAARPQERLQLRRMAEASLALAERRAGDLKVATEKLGGTPPTNRQLLMLRVMAVIAPPPSAGDSLFREVNDRILELGERFAFREEPLELICECEDGSCTERVSISAEEFAELRAKDGLHLVSEGHTRSGRVIQRSARE